MTTLPSVVGIALEQPSGFWPLIILFSRETNMQQSSVDQFRQGHLRRCLYKFAGASPHSLCALRLSQVRICHCTQPGPPDGPSHQASSATQCSRVSLSRMSHARGAHSLANPAGRVSGSQICTSCNPPARTFSHRRCTHCVPVLPMYVTFSAFQTRLPPHRPAISCRTEPPLDEASIVSALNRKLQASTGLNVRLRRRAAGRRMATMGREPPGRSGDL